MTRTVLPWIGLFLVLASACGEDPAAPQEFSWTLRVVDTDGAPMAGLRVAVENAIDPFPWRGEPDPGAKPRTVVRFRLPRPCEVEMEISDLLDDHVRTLLARTSLVAGVHQVSWNGRNDDDVPSPPGPFTVRMTAWEDGVEAWTGTTDMYMYLYDVDQLGVGETDADGSLTLRDPRRFPGLVDLEAQPVYDEDAVYRGTFDVLKEVDVSLLDPATQERMFRIRLGYDDGVNRHEVVWDPDDSGGGMRTVQGGERGGRDEPSPEPPVDYHLWHPYPNPFN